ncbi:hypothetical protein ACCO45_010215 [Purpureocillium lilacinum]|uniref:Uncharacterized protein n=1 Tax=Purpureocillium lilacinum TaxID=33203 RepID=A0ACC4DE53_PURLI
MLQGIFEPVAERKKSTLTRLMRDFPRRKFLLVGDSGEADLEVYTDLAMANPGRILAVFIRDVTTPERTGYFDSTFETARRKTSSMTLDDGRPSSNGSTVRQNSAPVTPIEGGGKTSTGPMMGTLIDFSDEPEQAKLDEAAALAQVKKANAVKALSATDLLSGKKAAPPPPAKPAALPRDSLVTRGPTRTWTLTPAAVIGGALRHVVVIIFAGSRRLRPLRGALGRDKHPAGGGSPTLGPVNKKLELWRRRLARAHEVLDAQGVSLYTWRRGQDVEAEAVGIVRQALEEMAREERRRRGR